MDLFVGAIATLAVLIIIASILSIHKKIKPGGEYEASCLVCVSWPCFFGVFALASFVAPIGKTP